MDIDDIIFKLSQDATLEDAEISFLADRLIACEISEFKIGAALAFLARKKSIGKELICISDILLNRLPKFKTPHGHTIADITGSGGDYHQTFNFSTAAAIVTAAAGHKVAKHGGRAATSLCGSADLIEALGIKLDMPQQTAEAGLDKVGFCFLFAPAYHKDLAVIGKLRKQVKFRTLFNFLGPLINPARPNIMVAGISDANYINDYASVFSRRPNWRGFVISATNGMDEITTSSNTLVRQLDVANQGLLDYDFSPLKYGFKACEIKDLKGDNAANTAVKLKAIFSGNLTGAITDAIILNAGFALSTLEKQPLSAAFKQAEKIIKSGKAAEKLEEIIKFYTKNA